MAKRTRRGGGRRSGGGFGGFNFRPAIAGIGSNLGAQALGGQYGPGVGTFVSGMVLKDPFSKDLGAYQLGVAIGQNINLPFFGGSGAGGTGGNGGSTL